MSQKVKQIVSTVLKFYFFISLITLMTLAAVYSLNSCGDKTSEEGMQQDDKSSSDSAANENIH
jgi:hypothetical protein